MNKDIFFILICIILGFIIYKLFKYLNKEHFTYQKDPDSYTNTLQTIVSDKPEIYDYDNPIGLIEKNQPRYSYHHIDNKIEVPNKVIKKVLKSILDSLETTIPKNLDIKNSVLVFDLNNHYKKNMFDFDKYYNEWSNIANSLVEKINKFYPKINLKSSSDDEFKMIKVNLLEIREFSGTYRRYIFNIHINRNKYSTFIVQTSVYLKIQDFSEIYQDISLISRAVTSDYDKIKADQVSDDHQYVYLVEDPEKNCLLGNKSKNVYCVMSTNDIGNRNNVIDKNHEFRNKEIYDKNIILKDNKTIKTMVDEYLNKHKKFIRLQK